MEPYKTNMFSFINYVDYDIITILLEYVLV